MMGVPSPSDPRLLNCTSGTKDYGCDCKGRLYVYACGTLGLCVSVDAHSFD